MALFITSEPVLEVAQTLLHIMLWSTVIFGMASALSAIIRIKAGQHYPHRDDGTVFRNNEKLLPQKAEGYYHEWVHPTPGAQSPRARRVITTPGDEIYFTPDHYDTFILVKC